MKTRLLTIVVLIVLGVAGLASVISASAEKKQTYKQNLESARKNAENDVPYTAISYYKKAFSVRCDDEDVYGEYLAQAEKLGEMFYDSAVESYLLYFPDSSKAYETVCEYDYQTKNYTDLFAKALESNQKGIATERIKELYMECAYMLRTVHKGLEEAHPFPGAYAIVKVDDLYGFMDKDGAFLITPKYQAVSPFLNGSAAVYDGTSWAMINEAGYIVARPEGGNPESMSFINDELVLVSEDGKYSYMSRALKLPEKYPFDQASSFKSGVAAVRKDGKWALIRSDSTSITDYIFEDVLLDDYNTCISNGVIFAKEGGKYYMYDAEGKKLNPEGFDNAYPMLSDGIAAVQKEGLWGFADKEGNYVLEPQYEEAKSFSQSLAPVKKDGVWYYISKTGEIRVEGPFEDCLPFNSNGIAAVKTDELWEYVQLYMYYYR